MLLFRRNICLFIAVLLLSSIHHVAAQSSYYIEEPKLFTGGLVLGGNFSQIDGDNFAGYNKAGLNAGGIVYVRIDEHIAASLEILYSQKGSRARDPIAVATGYSYSDYRISLNYAEIPVMINYVNKRKSNFGLGFSYSRLAFSSESFTSYPAQIFDESQYPFKKSDLNFLIGGNFHLWKGLLLNIRYQYSLFSIRNSLPQTSENAPQFNNMWVVRLMYLFM